MGNCNVLILHIFHRLLPTDVLFVDKYPFINNVPPTIHYKLQKTVMFLSFLYLFDSKDLGLALNTIPSLYYNFSTVVCYTLLFLGFSQLTTNSIDSGSMGQS